jgi:hypothetical protein
MSAVSLEIRWTNVGCAVGLVAMPRSPRGVVLLPAGCSLVQVVWAMVAGPIGSVHHRCVCPCSTLVRPGV